MRGSRRVPSVRSTRLLRTLHGKRQPEARYGGPPTRLAMTRLVVALEVLDCPLVLLSGGARVKGTQVPAPAGLRIFLSRVKAILARGQLANHIISTS